ncbi:MAG: hypothetical protein JXK07_16245 [Spirochaetes bacterium]|nr:hypothetical protein [Spirochaetota bacterium]MBN2770637.1 hypothetical protein [Spirochaetota bacterium]
MSISSLSDNTQTIEKTLKPGSVEAHQNASKTDNIKYQRDISALLIRIADTALYCSKQPKCLTCGITSDDTSPGTKCRKCGGHNFTQGKNQVTVFDDNIMEID